MAAFNPYLALAAMLAAGLRASQGSHQLPAEAINHIYEMSEDEQAVAGIRSLPEDLVRAIHLPAEAINHIYEMSEDEQAVEGIRSLPEDLVRAIHLAEGSKVLRDALGDHVHEFLCTTSAPSGTRSGPTSAIRARASPADPLRRIGKRDPRDDHDADDSRSDMRRGDV